jgi:hypothetical protein
MLVVKIPIPKMNMAESRTGKTSAQALSLRTHSAGSYRFAIIDNVQVKKVIRLKRWGSVLFYEDNKVFGACPRNIFGRFS